MKAIVPLAGPDFVISKGLTKAETLFEGQPLLLSVLNSRAWSADVEEYIFVLKDGVEERLFVDRALSKWFPLCRVCFVSHYTNGAAFSALAACSLVDSETAPIVVDLADIFFDCSLNHSKISSLLLNAVAIGLTFNSNDQSYSYLAFDEDGEFIEAQEKRVISANASAGVYIFENIGCFINAFSQILQKPEYKHNNLHYVCPVFNGVHINGGKVVSICVTDVHDIKQGK
jgi:hypothetical protein